MRIEATSLRHLSPSLRYFVLSETLHCATIKIGNVIVSRLSIKFAFTLYCAITKFGNVIVSRLSLKFAFTLHCAIIKFGNVIVSRLKFAFTSPVNKYNNDCLVHSLPGKLPSVIVTSGNISCYYPLDRAEYQAFVLIGLKRSIYVRKWRHFGNYKPVLSYDYQDARSRCKQTK